MRIWTADVEGREGAQPGGAGDRQGGHDGGEPGGQEADQDEGEAAGGRQGGDDELGAAPLAQGVDQEGAEQGADAEGTQQQAIDHRAAAQPVAGDQRQEGEPGGGGDAEHGGPGQDTAQCGRLADIAQAGGDGTAQALARQVVLGQLAAPEQQHGHQRQGGDAVEQEGRLGAEAGDHRPTHGGAERAGEVEADGVERDRGGQLLARHQLAHHRLPGRAVERRTGADQEGEQEQHGRRQQARAR